MVSVAGEAFAAASFRASASAAWRMDAFASVIVRSTPLRKEREK